jgi:tetratricopeptide (TPR) repeat protein
MGNEPIDIKSIFSEALQKKDAQVQAAYLDKACGNDIQLRAKVEALLKAHQEAGSFLNAPALGPDVTLDTSPLTEGPGTIIGRYKLLEQIGEGGFGVVYMAEQQEPIRRRVALKIIKLGMDTKQVIARFEAERQALAMMDHPNIAKVLDAGATDTGRPYFVMELVKGIPITEYCDKNNLDTRQRLELFIDVCKAVQHAHQKGIIHRDIKPSNVMITLHDGKPVPKVIDFGIAKATSHRLTEKTLFTKYAQMIGTPEYMSPEQAEMSGLDIDTRTDIYSLGVLLYELLTSATPFDAKELRDAGYAEMQRIIRETEPLRPSTKLNTMGDALTDIAKHRQSSPALLPKLVRGDLDWIAMKTLEKDRTRRYETANELAADINRHLGDELVLAGPPSVRYRLRKFVRRNRALVTGVSAVLVVLVAGIVVSTIFAVGQARARARAEFHAAMSYGTMEYFQNGFFVKGADVTVGELVETLSKEIELAEKSFGTPLETSDGPPLSLMMTAAHQALGNMYAGLEMYDKAEPHLERAYQFFLTQLGWKHEVTRHSLNNLALFYLRQGRYDKAEPLLAKALDIRRRVKCKYHDEMLDPMDNLGWRYFEQARYNEAERLFVKALEISRGVLGEEHPHTLDRMCRLASLYGKEGRYDKAEPLLIKALETSRRVHGEEHENTLWSMTTLGWQYSEQGRYKEAEPLLVKALEISRRTLGDEHPTTLTAMTDLGREYFLQGRYNDAERLLVKALEISRRTLGEENLNTTGGMWCLGGLYAKQGRYEEAEPLLVESLENIRRMQGEENRQASAHMDALGVLYTKQGRYDEAEPLLVKAVQVRRRLLGEEDPFVLEFMNDLAVLYREQSRYSEAESLFVKALEVRRRVLGDEHPDTLESMSDLALLYLKQGRYDEAEPLAISCYQGRSAKFGPEHAFTQDAIQVLAKLYDAWGKPEKAEQWRAKLPHKEGKTER